MSGTQAHHAGGTQLRLRGIIEECRRRGMTLDARLLGNVEQEWMIGAGAHATQELIDKGVPFDGVIGLNDQLAIAASASLSCGVSTDDCVAAVFSVSSVLLPEPSSVLPSRCAG